MSEEKILFISIITGILIIILIVIIALKLNKKSMKKIIETVNPIWVKFIDVLIIKVSTGEDDITIYLPVFQNNKDNKVYIPSQWGNYGYLTTTMEGIFSENPKIVSKNIKKEIVEYGKEGRLYIEKEKETVKIEDNIVTIERRKLTFKGKIEKIAQTNCIYNVSNDNILEKINGAIIYKGIVDFDMEGILKEKLN